MKLYAILAVLLCASISAADDPPKPFPNGQRPLVIAHRGFSREYPENTLLAMQAADEIGVDVLDMDAHMSADGHVVLMHDDTVDRTTDGTGLVIEKTLEQLKELDAGYRFKRDEGFPFRGKGVKIPTLDEVFAAFPNAQFSIEIKQGIPPMEGPLAEVVKKHGLERRVLVACADPMTLSRLRAMAPTIPTASDGPESLALRSGFSNRMKAGCVTVPPAFSNVEVMVPSFVRKVHSLGGEVFVWTVDDEAGMRKYLDMGADGIFSNRPDVLMRVIGRTPRAKRAEEKAGGAK
ncbi:MAG TPA: glycerophosphodiester phosphodiesterase [Candidatus Brocadiia bacterium]|nr:glycerophosphodiester phosphodiesterase [Candidatus Brocadiia bacterium]